MGGTILYSHGTSNSKGVAVLIKKKAPVKIGKVNRDEFGRTVMCEITFKKYHFNLVALYAPNRDDPEFFVQVFTKLTEFEKTTGINEKIIVGDFNLVMDIEKDEQGGRPFVTHSLSQELLKTYMEEEGVIDVWRFRKPDKIRMTWKTLNPQPIFERLDMILLSANLVAGVGGKGISPSYLSDHDIPWITLTTNDEVKGKGFWRLNNSLLSDPEYKTDKRVDR